MIFNKYKIADVCNVSAGGDAPKNLSPVPTEENHIPIYSNGVSNEGLYGYTDKATITEPAITISARGTIGAAFFRSEPYVPIVRLLSLIPKNKNVNVEYLYYVLSKMNYNVGASVQAQLTVPMISNYEVNLPSRKDQDVIANVLSTIDRKISLNRKANDVLEKMAKQIYDYWFVQFDFPDENGKPYKSSGGKMVYDETLKREIPEGWEVKSINNLCESNRGVTYEKSDLVSSDKGVLILRGNNIEGNHLVYDSNVAYVPKSFVSLEQKIRKYDIVMTMSSGSKEHVGKCIMFQEDSSHSYGAFLTKFTPYNYPHLIFMFFLSDFFKAKIERICSGTGINNLTNQTFDEILMALPSPDISRNICQKFEDILLPIFKKIGLNESICFKLGDLRDFLQPLLINGQVTIKEDNRI